METKQFKTTIKCSGCVATATPFLDKAVGEDNWEVDLQDPNRILTVTAGEEIADEKVISALQEAGYKAEKI